MSTLPRDKADKAWLAQLEKVLEHFAPQGRVSLSITGGEPTLSRRILGVLKLVKEGKARKSVMTTNGTTLLRKLKWMEDLEAKDVLQLLIDSGLQYLNISRAHYDDTINQTVMAFKGGMDAFSSEDLRVVAQRLSQSKTNLRLSLAMTNEGIHDFDGLVAYLEWAKSLGVKNVIVRQLYDFDIKAMEQNAVTDYFQRTGTPPSLEPIFRQVDADPRFRFVRQLSGYYYYVEVYDFNGIRVVLDQTDLGVLEHERLRRPIHNGRPTVYEMIYHSSGSLGGSWVDGQDQILVPNQAP
jgi:hypothetical protein